MSIFAYVHGLVTIVNMEEKIKQLESRIQELEQRISVYEGKQNEYATLVSPYVSGTPTNNGYVTVVMNGKRLKIATVS